MQNRGVVNTILNYVPTIDWSKSYQNEQVSLFETTIRYLAGILSAHDLLDGPLEFLADDVCDSLVSSIFRAEIRDINELCRNQRFPLCYSRL